MRTVNRPALGPIRVFVAISVAWFASVADVRGGNAEQAGPPATTNPGWIERQKLLAPDGEAGDRFGRPVAVDGDTAVIGAWGDDGFIGAGYTFERIAGRWTRAQKLAVEDGEIGDVLGNAAAISGDTVVLGADGDNELGENAGAAYVFERVGGEWTVVAKLLGDDTGPGSQFGAPVAISGDTALIGAVRHPGDFSGAVYVFERVNGIWRQTAKLTAHDGEPSQQFGNSVAVLGSWAFIGATWDHERARYAGAAYVFRKVDGVWALVHKLTAEDGREGARFGASISLSGDTAMIAARGDDERGESAGAVYAFRRAGDAWRQAHKITATDAEPYDYFGWDVELFGDTMLVGAVGRSSIGNMGAAYVFQDVEGRWREVAKLRASDGELGDDFGGHVALDRDVALVGADLDNDHGEKSGSVYVFTRDGGCTERERIVKAVCKGKPDRGRLTVKLAQGLPQDGFTITLSSGEVGEGMTNARGRGKAKFRSVASGAGTAKADWNCGASAERAYACP